MMTFNLFKTLCFSSLIFTSIMGAEEAPKMDEDPVRAKALAQRVIDFLRSDDGSEAFKLLADQVTRNVVARYFLRKDVWDRIMKTVLAKKCMAEELLTLTITQNHNKDFFDYAVPRKSYFEDAFREGLESLFLSRMTSIHWKDYSLDRAEEIIDNTIELLNSINASTYVLNSKKINTALANVLQWYLQAFCISKKLADRCENLIGRARAEEIREEADRIREENHIKEDEKTESSWKEKLTESLDRFRPKKKAIAAH